MRPSAPGLPPLCSSTDRCLPLRPILSYSLTPALSLSCSLVQPSAVCYRAANTLPLLPPLSSALSLCEQVHPAEHAQLLLQRAGRETSDERDTIKPHRFFAYAKASGCRKRKRRRLCTNGLRCRATREGGAVDGVQKRGISLPRFTTVTLHLPICPLTPSVTSVSKCS